MNESLLVEYDAISMQLQSLQVLSDPDCKIDEEYFYLPNIPGMESNMIAKKYSKRSQQQMMRNPDSRPIGSKPGRVPTGGGKPPNKVSKVRPGE